MHTDAERKYAAKAARVRRASRGRGLFHTRLYTGIQMKFDSRSWRVPGAQVERKISLFCLLLNVGICQSYAGIIDTILL